MSLAAAIFMLVTASAQLSVVGQSADYEEAARQALSSERFPWYDSVSDDVRSVDLRDASRAASQDRAEIPAAAPAPVRTRTISGKSFWGLHFVAWALIGLLVVLLTAVLIRTFLQMESKTSAPLTAEQSRTLQHRIAQLPLPLEQSVGNFRQLAQQARRNGDYDNAMIYLFSHSLLVMDERGLIRLRRGKTNRQYLQEVGGPPHVADYLRQIIVPFEATFFGDLQVDPAVFENCWYQFEEFERGSQHQTPIASS